MLILLISYLLMHSHFPDLNHLPLGHLTIQLFLKLSLPWSPCHHLLPHEEFHKGMG
jgi:hypothetical protein